MWLLLNNINYSSSLSVKKSLVHGVPARVGQINAFSIFVTCGDITSAHGYTCSVTLTDPNGVQAGNYALEQESKEFRLIEGETVESVNPFENGRNYFGYELIFPSDIALNMPGIWKATIGYYRQDKLIISGMFTFNVEDTGIDPGEDECAKRSELQALQNLMSNKADMTNSLFVKVWNFNEDLGDEDDMEIDISSPLSWLFTENRFINDYEGHESLYIVNSREIDETTGTVTVHYVKELDLFKHDKVDKVTTASPSDRVYAVLRNNTETALIVSDWTGTVSPTSNQIARYYSGRLITANPVNSYDAVNKITLENRINSDTALIKGGSIYTNSIGKASSTATGITVEDDMTFNEKAIVKTIESGRNDKGIDVAGTLYVDSETGIDIETSGRIVMNVDANDIADDYDVTNKGYVDSKVEGDVDAAKEEIEERIEDLNEKIAGKKDTYTINAADNGGVSAWSSDMQAVSISGTLHTITGDIMVSSLKVGDNVYITETNVPDRWVGNVTGNTARLFQLETAKVDITGKVDKTTTANQVYGTDHNGSQVTYDAILNIRDGSGQGSIEQNGCNTVGDNSIALGNDSIAYGNSSVAIGLGITTVNEGQVAVGIDNIGKEDTAFEIGQGTPDEKRNILDVDVNGSLAHEGDYVQRITIDSNRLTGLYNPYDGTREDSKVAGTAKTTATGHAEGVSTLSRGYASHAEGELTAAVGEGSHSEGQNTKASGNGSHSEGIGTEATGRGSSAHGIGTAATREGQAVFGKYNGNKTNTVFEVGNGTSSSDRKNAFEVYSDGHAEIQTQGMTDDSIAKKQYVDAQVDTVREIAQGKKDTIVCSIYDNPLLNTQDALVTVTQLTSSQSGPIDPGKLSVGDNVLIEETEVPDRWVSDITQQTDGTYRIMLRILETQKVDISGKLDKVTGTTAYHQVYGKSAAGNQTMFNASTESVGSTLAMRDANGNLKVHTPASDGDAANKKYVDESITSSVSRVWRGI